MWYTPQARIARAFRAGIAARLVLAGVRLPAGLFGCPLPESLLHRASVPGLPAGLLYGGARYFQAPRPEGLRWPIGAG